MSGSSNWVTYSSVTAYNAARDSIIERLDNLPLTNGVVGSGRLGAQGTANTIGYGYDITAKTGARILIARAR